MKRKAAVLLTLAILASLVARPAEAYVGPGSGLSVIGAALAFLGGIVLVIVGFIWYPVKRLWRWLGAHRSADAATKSIGQ